MPINILGAGRAAATETRQRAREILASHPDDEEIQRLGGTICERCNELLGEPGLSFRWMQASQGYMLVVEELERLEAMHRFAWRDAYADNTLAQLRDFEDLHAHRPAGELAPLVAATAEAAAACEAFRRASTWREAGARFEAAGECVGAARRLDAALRRADAAGRARAPTEGQLSRARGNGGPAAERCPMP